MRTPNRLRVLIPVQWFEPVGGIEVFLQNVLPGLMERFEVALAVQFANGRPSPLPIPAEVEVFELPMRPTLAQLRMVLDSFGPDVLHLQTASLGWIRLMWLAQQRGVRVAWTLHQAPENLNWMVPGISPAGWVAYRLLASRCAQVVAPSPYIARRAARHSITAEVISCGVDTTRFRPGDQATARRALGLADRPTGLFVGRFVREKNGLMLLRAVERLTRTRDFQLVMVGPTPDLGRRYWWAHDLAQRLIDRGALKLVGPVPHSDPRLPLYFQAADVFAFPSLFETQSVVTVEALASGLPVLASNRSALPDLVKPGLNGRLCDPFSVADITQQLSALLDDKLRGVNADQHHQLAFIAQRYSDVYYTAAYTKKRSRRSAFWAAD